MDYRVLLYYKYTTIDDPETFAVTLRILQIK